MFRLAWSSRFASPTLSVVSLILLPRNVYLITLESNLVRGNNLDAFLRVTIIENVAVVLGPVAHLLCSRG